MSKWFKYILVTLILTISASSINYAKPILRKIIQIKDQKVSDTLPDRLATDLICSKYRTCIPDSKSLRVPENIQKGLSEKPEIYCDSLVNYLTSDTKDAFLKIKRIHDWITDNIGYFNDAFYGYTTNIKDNYQILKEKKTTCGGFSSLFKLMALKAGIETITIKGMSRSSFNEKSDQMSNHLWNAVNINSKWYIVDATHDGRFSFTNGIFSKKSGYRDNQLFISSEAKLIDNIPDDPKYQFSDNPISKEEFLSRPLISLNFKKYGLEFITNIVSIINKEKIDDKSHFSKITEQIKVDSKILKIEIKKPTNVRLKTKITNDKKESFEAYTYVISDNNKSTCMFSSPERGTFTATISAKEEGKDSVFYLVYSFTIIGKSNNAPKLPIAGELFETDLIKKYNVTIITHNFNSNDQELFIELEHSNDYNVFAGIYADNEKSVKLKGKSTNNMTDPNKILTRIKLPATDEKEFLVKIKAKKADEKLYNDVIALIRINKK